jgi:hypothetical protein
VNLASAMDYKWTPENTRAYHLAVSQARTDADLPSRPALAVPVARSRYPLVVAVPIAQSSEIKNVADDNLELALAISTLPLPELDAQKKLLANHEAKMAKKKQMLADKELATQLKLQEENRQLQERTDMQLAIGLLSEQMRATSIAVQQETDRAIARALSCSL